MPARFVRLALFVVVVFGLGSAIGILTAPGEWYAGLVKPSFNPPNWVFGPVWGTLYVMIAVAGWRTWERAPRGRAMRLWFAQIAFNFLWSPVFFGAHQVGLGLVVILAMLAAITAFIGAVRREDRVSALLFVPYWLWVAFASVLNLSFLVLNGVAPA